MANGYSIPIIVTHLTPQQRADILLAEWQSLRRERGVQPGQMLVLDDVDLDRLVIWGQR
jgi:hypothetical protein